jgi:hypothetical protein
LLTSANCTADWLHKPCSAVSRTVQFCKSNLFLQSCAHCGGRNSSVGIVTDYGMEGPRIESWWGEIFHTRTDRPRGPPSLLYNGYRSFQRVKLLGRGDDQPPILAPRSRKNSAITLTPSGPSGLLWGTFTCFYVRTLATTLP